jgi:hypothetical protein
MNLKFLILKKKVLLAPMLFLSSVIVVNASNTDSIVNIWGRWAKFSTKNIEIERCREKSNAKDGLFLHQCSASLVKLTVEDSTKSGYVIDWYYSKISLDDSYKNADAITKYILQITKGMTIKFSTDSIGELGQILNWDEIKTFFTARADSMSSLIGYASVEQIDNIRTKLIALVNNKDQLQNVLLQDIQLYFSLYGYTLNSKTPLVYNGFFSDQFGGDPFPSKGIINLKSIDTLNKKCEVVWHQRADSVQEKQILKKAFTNQAAIAGKPAPTDADIPNIRIYDDYYFLFDIKSGWSQKLNYKRTTATDKMQEVDSVDFKVF